MNNEHLKQANLSEIEKNFEPVIGYKSIKKEMITICEIMQNREFYAKTLQKCPLDL